MISPMPIKRDLNVLPFGEAPHSTRTLETAAILAQADRDCDAGLGLSGADAKAFLGRVLDAARARVEMAEST